jgi:hypothetical protein
MASDTDTAPVADLHAELLYHLHGFSHGIAELGHGWEQLATRVCLNCVPCVGRPRGCGDDHAGCASPPQSQPGRRPLPTPLVAMPMAQQAAVAA